MPQNKSKIKSDKKILNKPAPVEQLTIMVVNEFKGYYYLIQEIGMLVENKRLYQYILFNKENNQFYQTYFTIKPDVEGVITMKQVAETTLVVKEMVEATVIELIKMKNPDYKPEEYTEDDQAKAEVIVEALENVDK